MKCSYAENQTAFIQVTGTASLESLQLGLALSICAVTLSILIGGHPLTARTPSSAGFAEQPKAATFDVTSGFTIGQFEWFNWPISNGLHPADCQLRHASVL